MCFYNQKKNCIIGLVIYKRIRFSLLFFSKRNMRNSISSSLKNYLILIKWLDVRFWGDQVSLLSS